MLTCNRQEILRTAKAAVQVDSRQHELGLTNPHKIDDAGKPEPKVAVDPALAEERGLGRKWL